MASEQLTFWQHLEVLRAVLFRCLGITLLFGVMAFCLKNQLFALILAPQHTDFCLYRGLEYFFHTPELAPVELINTGLAQQFMVHLRVSLHVGLLCASPYLLFECFHFISPALYQHERKVALRAVLLAFVLFWFGVLLNYFVIFPFTFRFLGTYQVSTSVTNLIDLGSYISTLLTLSLLMGLVFEMPVLCLLLSKLHLLSASLMKRFRRHAVVFILIVSAVITPTGDAFTLCLVAVPVYLLYEFSILLVARVQKEDAKKC